MQLAKVFKVDLLTLLGEETHLIQTNINQQGGQAAAQMNVRHETDGKDKVYEGYITDLKEQIEYLKGLIKKESK